MKNLVVKTLKILPLILGAIGMILPPAMSQTHSAIANELSPRTLEVLPKNDSSETTLSTSEVDPAASEVLQQIQRVRQPKGFQASTTIMPCPR